MQQENEGFSLRLLTEQEQDDDDGKNVVKTSECICKILAHTFRFSKGGVFY